MEPETWAKSSYCEASGCVWVAVDDGGIHVSQDRRNFLTFSREEWADFLTGVKAGEFDLA